MAHTCTCGDCAAGPFEDACKFEKQLKMLRDMTARNGSLIELLSGYEQRGWIVVAVPPDIGESLIGRPATQQNALAWSARIQQKIHFLEMMVSRDAS